MTAQATFDRQALTLLPRRAFAMRCRAVPGPEPGRRRRGLTPRLSVAEGPKNSIATPGAAP